MKHYLIITLATAIIAVSLPVHAGNQDRSINKRQHQQAVRIHQGIESGELTRPETRRLAREQIGIRKMERRFRSDGELTIKERARLQHRLDHASRHIYREKHDAEKRGGGD